MSTTSSSSSHDQNEGKAKEVIGGAQEAIGKAIGSEKMESEGADLKFEGQVEGKIGDIKKVVGL